MNKWGIIKAINGGIEHYNGNGDKVDSEFFQSILDLDIEKLKQSLLDGADINAEIEYTKEDNKTISGTPLYYLLSTNPIKPELKNVQEEDTFYDGGYKYTKTTTYKKATKESIKKAELENIDRETKLLEMAEFLMDNGAKFKTTDKDFKIKFSGLKEIAERVL